MNKELIIVPQNNAAARNPYFHLYAESYYPYVTLHSYKDKLKIETNIVKEIRKGSRIVNAIKPEKVIKSKKDYNRKKEKAIKGE